MGPNLKMILFSSEGERSRLCQAMMLEIGNDRIALAFIVLEVDIGNLDGHKLEHRRRRRPSNSLILAGDLRTKTENKTRAGSRQFTLIGPSFDAECQHYSRLPLNPCGSVVPPGHGF